MPTMKIKTYEDVEELPIYNWFKVHSTGDYSWILIKKRTCNDKELTELSVKWRALYDQYITFFGFNDNFLSILEKRREIALLMIEKAETDNGTIETIIEIRELELQKKIQQSSGGENFYEIKSYVEKQKGFQIDIRKMSVVEFYTDLNLINNGKQ